MTDTSATATAHESGPTPGEVVMVGPELAGEYLAHNTHNRRPRATAVGGYVQDMLNGDWRWTGDPIRFDVNGVLIDGQHRLLAIVESGVTIPLLVLRGLAAEAQDDIDAGVPRKFYDVLALHGEVNSGSLAAIVRKVAHWEQGRRGDSTKGSKPTTAALLRVLDAHPELRDVAREAKTICTHVDLPASLVGLVYWLFTNIDEEDAQFFFARLSDGQSLAKGDPIYQLRSTISTSRAQLGERNQRYLLAVTIKAWNAYREGETVGQLRFRTGGAKPERFPEPK